MPVRRRSGLLAAVAISSSACFAYRPAVMPPPPKARVRLVFASAMPVTTRTLDSTALRRTYPDVLEASGTIQAAAGDTLALLLGELRTAQGQVAGVAGQVALVPTAKIARAQQRRFQAGTTILTGASVLVVASATLVVLLIAAITRGF